MEAMFTAAAVLGAACLLAYLRHARWWIPRFSATPGTAFLWRSWRHRDGRHFWRVGIFETSGSAFCLKPETMFDRYAKHVGLSREQEIGRALFDAHVYLVSDDTRVARALAESPGLAETLAELFRDPKSDQCVRRLYCRGGRLWFEGSTRAACKQFDIESLANRLLPTLHGVNRALRDASARVGTSGQFGNARVFVLMALCIAGVLHGALALSTGGSGRMLVIIDHTQLLLSALAVMTLATMALAGIGVMWLAGSSRAHLVLLEVTLLGALGAGTTAYAELREYNMRADRSEPTQIESQVLERHQRSAGKGSTSYHAVFDARHVAGHDTVRMRVDAHTFRRLAVGQRVTLVLREGALGYRWISAMTPHPQD
jgi:hypothetical protein